MIPQQQIEAFYTKVQQIRDEIKKEIIGQDRVVEQLLTAMIAGGNVLLEGVPGLGKTRLVRTLSQVFELPFSRIQFTPDLMPADITGTSILVKTEEGSAFRFRKGPVFASIVLADEINRATPKTQAALLEAMQEHSVTVGGETHALSDPYFVLATQNPMEQEGTYPLPEAQLDRFMLKILVEFPTLEELSEIVGLTTVPQTARAQRVADAQTLLELRAVAQEVPMAQAVRDFALRLVLGTHPELPESPETVRGCVRFGASPRAAQALVATSRVRALMNGRYNVAFEDVEAVAPACLRHRIALSFEGMARGETVENVIDGLLHTLPRG
ncbi:MAG: MoxR family ATPase [Clostridiales bacterium]|nr:MoxR family ATPase [Clostridiales bacterium]MDO4351204.1 MoxR family ATPase [Eubacteriales bacterium]MDY4008027.1 MoxR family ATPase [Candidatus Limiplasma sp.]